MATARTILGQANPAATTDAVLYTSPALTDTVCSTLVVSETNGVAATVRICVSSAGATTTAASRSIAWDVAVPANGVLTFTLGITLGAAHTVIVRSSTANVTYTLFGQQNT